MTAAGVLLFLAGMMTGLTLDRRLMGQPVAPPVDEPNRTEATSAVARPTGQRDVETRAWLEEGCDPASPEMLDTVARRVRQILGLKAEQEKQIRDIIEKYHPRMKGLRRQFEPELRALSVDVVGDLLPVLETKQRERFMRILNRHARWLARAVSQPTSPPAKAGDSNEGK